MIEASEVSTFVQSLDLKPGKAKLLVKRLLGTVEGEPVTVCVMEEWGRWDGERREVSSLVGSGRGVSPEAVPVGELYSDAAGMHMGEEVRMGCMPSWEVLAQAYVRAESHLERSMAEP